MSVAAAAGKWGLRKIRIFIRKREKKRLGYVVKQDVRADVNAELIKAQLQRDLSFFSFPFRSLLFTRQDL
jgi:hypothetical protein